MDVLVVAENGRKDAPRIQELVYEASEAEGFLFVYLSAHVRDPAHIAHKRAINDFFMREVDRDKIVLFGEP